jgi:Family of unknown function (DUF5941)/CDP-alcohol phosphatidyltransferase
VNIALTETRAPVRRTVPVSPGSAVVLMATAAAADGGPAALQPWEGDSLLARLAGQFTSLGIEHVHVLTRPAWAEAVRAAAADVRVHAGEGAADDLRAIAAIAAEATGPLVVAYGDIVTQREVLAGLLAEPRIRTGVLTTGGKAARPFGFKTRSNRGRIVSAGSPYHAVRRPTGTFLGVVKVAPADRPGVPAVAEQLAALVEHGPPADWREELDYKAGHWHRVLALRALDRAPGDPSPERAALDATPLSAEDTAELDRRRAAAPDDVTSLLLVGVIRSGVHVGASRLRSLFWARPTSPAALQRAAEEILEHDEDRELLNSAVKGSDGFFTTFFVSTYSKYIARWAAQRGLTPNQVTLVSIAVGVLAAACFAYAERWSMVVGGLLVYFAFVLDCVDGQLARYTRQFSKLGAWLDSIFDRSKEYVVFAGLAIGASRTGDPLWVLAGAALALQTTRHAIDFSFPASAHQLIAATPQPPIEHPYDGPRPVARTVEEEEEVENEDAPPREPAQERLSLRRRLGRLWRASDRNSSVRWAKKILTFPIGERFAAIAVTAALFDARVTFTVMLVSGGLAFAYVLLGRVLRSLLAAAAPPAADGRAVSVLELYRDDGPLATAIGRALGRALPLPAIAPLVVAALSLAAALLLTGDGASDGLVAGVVAWVVLAGGLAAGRPLTDRLRWTVPPVLRAIEYAGLLWIGAVAGADALPATFALLCAITYHHYDTVYGFRHRGVAPPAWLRTVAGGWDGRLVLAVVLLVAGALPAAFWILAGLFAVLFAGESIAEWQRVRAGDTPVYDDEEDEAD